MLLANEGSYFATQFLIENHTKIQDELQNVPFYLSFDGNCFSAPEPNIEAQEWTLEQLNHIEGNYCYTPDAIRKISEALVSYLNSKGIGGVYVYGKPQDGAIVFHIHAARVSKINTVNRRYEEPINHPSDQRILKKCPLKDTEDELLYHTELENYLAYMNRHPNRRIDAQIYTFDEPDLVGIDLLISENKPWRVYFNASNTDPNALGKWQESAGFMHTQVSGRDDILKVDASTDNFDSFYTVYGLYDAPFFNVNRMRWSLNAMTTRYSSAEYGFSKNAFIGNQTGTNLQLKKTVYQDCTFFADFFAGVNYLYIRTHNHLVGEEGFGIQSFASPIIGMNFEKFQNAFRLFASIQAQGSPDGFLASNRNDLVLMGRMNPSKSWAILNSQFFVAFYLNKYRLVHEFLLSAQGQYAFNERLIPQLKSIVGGISTVRGYPQALTSGDSTAVGRFEYLFHFPNSLGIEQNPRTLFGQPFRFKPQYPGGRADWDLVFRAFVDAARVINNQIETPEQDDTLVGAGLGLEFVLKQNFILRGDWGHALTDAINVTAGHNQFYFVGTVAY